MTKAAKTRVFLLLLATFSTVAALTPPQPAQACIPYEIYYCYQSNGAGCQQSDCAQFNTCDGTESNCGYLRVECCH